MITKGEPFEVLGRPVDIRGAIVQKMTRDLSALGFRYLAELNEGGSITLRIFPGLDEA